MYTSHLLAKKWSQEIQYVQTTDNIQRILLLLYSFQNEERSLELIEKHCDDDGVVGFRLGNSKTIFCVKVISSR